MALRRVSTPSVRAAVYPLTRTKTSFEWAQFDNGGISQSLPAGTYMVNLDTAGGNFSTVRFNERGGTRLKDVTVAGDTAVYLPWDANVYVSGPGNRTEEQVKVPGALLVTPVTPLSLS